MKGTLFEGVANFLFHLTDIATVLTMHSKGQQN